jgi:hypothetical protein
MSYEETMPSYDERMAMKKVDIRYVEDDIKILKEIEQQIDELLKSRLDRLETIRRQHSINDEMVQDSYRWFSNNVVGISESSGQDAAEPPRSRY